MLMLIHIAEPKDHIYEKISNPPEIKRVVRKSHVALVSCHMPDLRWLGAPISSALMIFSILTSDKIKMNEQT